ncbi:MAG: hypothetical protein F6K08_22260, partial [Okeania sp. SIO1H6]|nr:hypothetical protein [Okeania sp. SIO1H6]
MLSKPPVEEGDRRQETGDRRKITWGFSPQVILNTVYTVFKITWGE